MLLYTGIEQRIQMKRLHHNGVLVPPAYEGKSFTIKLKGETFKLTPEQEEMAVAWVRKMRTPYVESLIFAKNFHNDFSRKLAFKVKPGDIDFSKILDIVEAERARKANLSKEEKKQLSAQKKAQKTANKERNGYAWVDGVRMEVANYTVEPNSIFIGRGNHPLRGRWKVGPREEDIELNLSPDASRPLGNWKTVIWKPNAMWIARWKDKLAGKIKYIWLSDSSTLKQRKEIEKFDKARKLRLNLVGVQRHIWKNIDSHNLRRRKTATVCFLIDKLKIRVGDEKDPDEADTVGASTLRPEHIHFNSGFVTFNFLGKDSVPHVFRVKLPGRVIRNLKEFSSNAKPILFNGVDSKQVSEFLDEVMTGLSAKVFRTCYTSQAVEKKLDKTSIKPEDPEYVKKFVATIANLEAAKICNHRRTIPKTWKQSLEKKKKRLKVLKGRVKELQKNIKQSARGQEEKYQERLKKQEKRLKSTREKIEAYRQQFAKRKQQGKSIKALKTRITIQQQKLERQKQRLKELKVKHAKKIKNLMEKLDTRRKRDKAAIDKLKLQTETKKKTRDYNLRTSLKSYIDPRIYYEWGKKVDYEWTRYYPKALQIKFSWVNGSHF